MILIIDNYDSFTHNLSQIISLYYSDVRVVRNDKITIQEIEKLCPIGIVLSPGPGRPEDAGICVDLVRKLSQTSLPRDLITGPTNSMKVDPVIKSRGRCAIPLLGVCLGHQAIVVALGGRVIRADEIVHGKDDLIFHGRGSIYQSISSPFKAGRYHSLIAERESLPSTVLVEAENAQKIVMGIRHRDLPLYGVQFHPESILTPDGNLLLREFVTLCENQRGPGVKYDS